MSFSDLPWSFKVPAHDPKSAAVVLDVYGLTVAICPDARDAEVIVGVMNAIGEHADAATVESLIKTATTLE